MARGEHSVVKGSAYILVLSALLFWLPVLGPAVAGFLGGRKAGSLTGGVMAGVIPAVLVGALTYVVVNALPDIGGAIAFVVGLSVGIWTVGNMLGAIVAAAVGGFLEEQETPA